MRSLVGKWRQRNELVIFLSHSGRDASEARQLARLIEQHFTHKTVQVFSISEVAYRFEEMPRTSLPGDDADELIRDYSERLKTYLHSNLARADVY